jgi:hypothetical protein
MDKLLLKIDIVVQIFKTSFFIKLLILSAYENIPRKNMGKISFEV